MSDLELMVQAAHNLSNTLSRMANDEIKFGSDLCYMLEQISYDAYKTANELKEINSYLVGGSA